MQNFRRCGVHYLSFLIVLSLLLFTSGNIFAGSLVIDTKGYTSGQLSKLNRERTFGDTIVGEILLGNESVTLQNLNNQSVNLVTNPWRFCFNEDHYDELEELIGNHVVVEYRTPKSSRLLSCSATNELLAISPVTEDYNLEIKQFVGNISTFDREVSHGVEFGRITNLIHNKDSFRSFFMTIQVGNGGDRFRHFVIDDSDLFEFAVENLKIANRVKIHYSDRLSTRTFDRQVIKSFVSEIEVID